MKRVLVCLIALVIASLVAIQPAIAGPPGTGGQVAVIYQGGACGPANLNTYPTTLCGAPALTIHDSLGYLNRACGSYVAWMETSTGHYMPPFHGPTDAAGYWPTDYPQWVVQTPEPGDAAVIPHIAGQPTTDTGHALYIVATNYDGTGELLVKQYNYAGSGDFSEALWDTWGISAINGQEYNLVYLQFPAAVSPQPRE